VARRHWSDMSDPYSQKDPASIGAGRPMSLAFHTPVGAAQSQTESSAAGHDPRLQPSSSAARLLPTAAASTGAPFASVGGRRDVK